MYVVPYPMGPVGSLLSKFGIEITDSPYVVVNMRIMTRMGKPALDQLGTSQTSAGACTASGSSMPKAGSSPPSRRLARSGASDRIFGLEAPDGEVTYMAAAFPNACGKTNLSMLVPPPLFKGYRVWTVGDDIAWMRARPDGWL